MTQGKSWLAVLAALCLSVAGPSTERFETTHGPRLILLLALATALAWRGLLPVRAWRAPEWLLVASVAAAGLSGAFATSPAYALTPVALLFAVAIAALGTAQVVSREVWLWWIALAAVAVAVLATLELAGLLQLVPRGRAPASTMGQRNSLAHFLVLASPVVWWQALRDRRWLGAAALLAGVVLATRSRAAWLVGPMMLLVFVALTRRRAALEVGAAVVGGVTLAALAPVMLVWNRADPYLDSWRRLLDWRSGSGAGRLHEWRESLELFKGRPLAGVGPGNWFVEYGVTHGGDHFAHSDLVGLLIERGLAGAVLWLALGVALLVCRPQPLVRCTVLGALALGLFDAVLQLPAPLLLVTLVAWVGSSAEVPAVPSRARGIATTTALLAVFTSLLFGSRLLATARSTPFDRLECASTLDPLDGELHVTLAEAWASAGDCANARRHADAARWLIPRHPRLPGVDAVCPRSLP